MGIGVVGNEMSGGGDSACDVRTRHGEFPNQEKGCFSFVASEDVEQTFSMDVIGPVVVGEREIARICASRNHPTIELGGWRVRVVGEHSSSGCCGGDCELGHSRDSSEKG